MRRASLRDHLGGGGAQARDRRDQCLRGDRDASDADTLAVIVQVRLAVEADAQSGGAQEGGEGGRGGAFALRPRDDDRREARVGRAEEVEEAAHPGQVPIGGRAGNDRATRIGRREEEGQRRVVLRPVSCRHRHSFLLSSAPLRSPHSTADSVPRGGSAPH